MDALFLAAYVALPLLTWWRSRSITWTVIATVGSISLVGAFISFAIDHIALWNRTGLQLALLVALLAPVVIAFIRRPLQDAPRRRQLLVVGLPVIVLAVYFAVVTTWWTDVPAFHTPVSFLMGHSLAEDNAKWLDFSSALASGNPMSLGVPMGGPLQLVLVFVATCMGVISQVTLHGYNQVMVAANTVIYSQFLLVVIAPLALAPLVAARLRKPVTSGGGALVRIPWPLIGLGALVLVATNLLLTAYGHLTLQFTILICTLWVTTFLTWTTSARALLITSMAVAVGMTVWLPMNAIAGMIVIGWLVALLVRGVRGGAWDGIGLAIVGFVIACIWTPMLSSVTFLLDSTASAMAPSGGAGGVRTAATALAHVPVLGNLLSGVTDSTLFEAGGGTEKATAILGALAAVAAIAAAFVVSRQSNQRGDYLRFIPVFVLAGFAIALNGLDQWATGSAPHYGSYKFTFMVTMVLIASCVPVGFLLMDPAATGMTLVRWVGIGVVIFLLIVDSLLVRSIAAARPTQWSPPIPFNNPQSYWWPADVNGTGTQPVSKNPVACVYLPQGAKAPSAILDSKLSDPQRVYSCTRLLAGLANEDSGAQPLVDWLRREWLSNTRAWSDVWGSLEAMPTSVKTKPVILLDDGSNVIGLMTVEELLQRYPASAGQSAQ